MNAILLSLSFNIFVGYLLYVQLVYGTRKSISDSYYFIKHPWIFTLIMWGISIPLMIVGSTGLMFGAGAFICFVGAAPNFKDPFEGKVHVVGAEGGIALAGASMWFDLHMWYMPVILIVFTAYTTSKWNKIKNHTWWIEVLAFTLIFISLLIKRVL